MLRQLFLPRGVNQIMRRTIALVIAVGMFASGATMAHAVFVDSMDHYIECGYHRNVLWPWPYVCPDRIAEREPFEIMVRNGWHRQNLLGSYHFDPSTGQLTEAGQLQVRWIMTQAPLGRRQIFVERALDPAVTAARLVAARQYASRVAVDGQSPQVYETNLMAEGRPAPVVDATNVKFMENMRVPALPASTAGGGGSSAQ
jgi:hypothetical protein